MKFFDKLFSKESPVEKELRGRLDALIGESKDLSHYDAKFYDAEPSSFSGNGMYQIAGIDQTVNVEQLQRLYATETWVFIAVNAVAQAIAALPFQLQKRVKIKKSVTNKITGEVTLTEQDHWSDCSGNSLFDRFMYPNKFTTAAEFYTLLVIDLLTAGQFYVYLDSDENLTTVTTADEQGSDDPNSPFGRLRQAMSDGKTSIKGMYRIPPSLMKPVPSEDGLSIEGYALHASAGAYAYNQAEIIHVKLPNPNAPLEGLSPLVPVMKPLLLDRFSTEHMIRFYKSGARLGGVIQTDKDMTKEQLGRFQRSFENNYTGRQNHHRTLILPPGMKYELIEQNPAETALIEFCKYNREAILGVFKVPPIKAGIMDNANYANALIQERQFFNDGIKPILAFIENGFNLKNTLIPDSRNFRFKFDLSEIEALKDNFKEKAEAAKFMVDSGLTINEVRDQVWGVGPIEDGDKCKVLEDIKKGKDSGGGLTFMGAPKDGVESKEVDPDSVQGILAGMPGPMVTQIMNILGRVSRGRVSPDAALVMLHTIHGIPDATCRELLGMEPEAPVEDVQKDAVSDSQPDAANASGVSSTGQTFSQRVAQLTAIFMSEGKLPMDQAIPRAMDQARLEGYTDAPQGDKDGEGVSAPSFIPTGMAHDPGHPKGPCEKCKKEPCECPPGEKKPTLEEFIKESLSKLDPKEQVTEEFLKELNELYSQVHGEPVTNKEGEIGHNRTYAFGMTKDQVVTHWKSFIEKTEPIIQKRHAEVVTFFKSFKAIVMGKLGANVKAYGLHKVRTKSDEDNILSGPEYDALIKQYEAEIAKIDSAMEDAHKFGYTQTLENFTFDVPTQEARDALKAYAAKKIVGIMDTTKDQIRNVLSEGFDANLAIAAISANISNKFTEIEQGRAQTIARTETLTAVSMGREQKRQDFQEEFPEQKLMKMWISSQDEKVRDSHADLDGVSVPADESFDNGCAYPRDPEGDADEVINCRCSDITHVEEDTEALKDQNATDSSEGEDSEE